MIVYTQLYKYETFKLYSFFNDTNQDIFDRS